MKTKKIAAYVLKHNASGKMYIGSSGDVEKRLRKHRFCLNNKTHNNKNLQEAFDHDSDLIVMFIEAKTREEAYDIEQKLLDRHFPTGKLFNIATNARTSMKGLEPSDYNIQRTKETHTGKIVSETTRYKMHLVMKDKRHTKETCRKMSENRPKKIVTVNGVEYASMKLTAAEFGITITAVRKRINSKSDKFKNWNWK